MMVGTLGLQPIYNAVNIINTVLNFDEDREVDVMFKQTLFWCLCIIINYPLKHCSEFKFNKTKRPLCDVLYIVRVSFL